MQFCEVSKRRHTGFIMSAHVTTVNKLERIVVPGVGICIDKNVLKVYRIWHRPGLSIYLIALVAEVSHQLNTLSLGSQVGNPE